MGPFRPLLSDHEPRKQAVKMAGSVSAMLTHKMYCEAFLCTLSSMLYFFKESKKTTAINNILLRNKFHFTCRWKKLNKWRNDPSRWTAILAITEKRNRIQTCTIQTPARCNHILGEGQIIRLPLSHKRKEPCNFFLTRSFTLSNFNCLITATK